MPGLWQLLPPGVKLMRVPQQVSEARKIISDGPFLPNLELHCPGLLGEASVGQFAEHTGRSKAGALTTWPEKGRRLRLPRAR